MINSKKVKILGILFFILGLFYAPKMALAYNEYQKCDSGTTCTVGEFLYDDSYVPIATANCTFTSRYPDGSLFVNSDAMDSQSDGWYSYLVEATGSAGLYRSQICCTAGADYLCLDKSFKVEASASALTKQDVADAVWDEPRASHTQSGSFGEALQNIVPSASDISTAVWGYSTRTLSAFGTLPSDVWSYSTRTLSSFGTLIADLWNHTDRTITSGGSTTSNTTNNYTTNNNTTNSIDTSSFAKKSDVDSLKNEVIYNQTLLEKMVNKPIIKNYLEEEQDIDIESKLIQSRATMIRLSIDSNLMDSKLGMIDIKWKEMDTKKLTASIKEIETLNSAIIEGTKKMKESWSFPQAESLYFQASALKSRITIVQNELLVEEKPRIVLDDINSLNNSLDGFISLLGLPKDTSEKQTLFGRINEIKELADTFDLYSSDADKLLSEWKKYQVADIQEKTNKLAENLAKVNKLPNSLTVSSAKYEDSLSKKLKNRVLSIKATIQANKILLAKNTEKPFSNSWLEEGSVVFKTLLTNPSSRITQEVPLKYYLPVEIKKEVILDIDNGLKVEYDVEKKQLYVEGAFTLGPSESKIVSVRTQDIWSIGVEAVESLRHQAEELSKPLEKTSYFGQGVTIKSNIDVALDKILTDQKSAITPEAKIRSYYEAQIAIKSVKDQLGKLQDLVTQSGSFGSMAGFVGGAQAIAVWGIIIIMIAGFVFLVIYMKVLQGKKLTTEPVKEKKVKKNKKTHKPELSGFSQGQLIRFAAIFFVLGSVMSSLTSFAIFKATIKEKPNKTVSQVKDSFVSPVPDREVLGVSSEVKNKKEPLIITVDDLKGDILRIRETPNGKIVENARSGDEFNYIEEKDGWVRVELKDGTGWVNKDFVTIEK